LVTLHVMHSTSQTFRLNMF